MDKKVTKFNPSNWQGRSQKQVESNYKVMGYGLAIILFIGIVGTLISFISGVLV